MLASIIYYSEIILSKMFTYYSQNYAGIIGAGLITMHIIMINICAQCVISVFCNGRVCDGIFTMMSITDGENKKFIAYS